MRTLLVVLLIIVLLMVPFTCSRRAARKETVTKDTVTSAPKTIFATGAGGRPMTMTIDSIPEEAWTALQSTFPTFIPYRAEYYSERSRSGHQVTANDGMGVARLNLAGAGLNAYALAGRKGDIQEIIGLVRTSDGWLARSVANRGIPPNSPLLAVARRPRANPNGKWDGVAMRILDPAGAYEDVYWWDPERRRFFMGSGRQ